MPKKISQLVKTLLTSLTFLLFVMHSAARAELSVDLPSGNKLELIGIGMHQELRNDIYIGALFGPAEISNVDDLKNDSIAKRMSIRLVSKYSHRKMSRHWKERLAMNNSRNEWRPLTKEIVQFSRIFKRSMQTGDEINIDYVPGVGTQVYLNGTLFQTIDKQGFANLLLNVWLGATPPTKAFKKSIRGQDNQDIQQGYVTTFSALQPIKGRFDADLVKPETKVAKAETKPAPKKTAPRSNQTKKSQPKAVASKKTNSSNKKVASKTSSQNKPKAKTPTKKSESKKKSPATNSKKLIAENTPDIKPDLKIETSFDPETPQKSAAQKTPSKSEKADKKVEKVASLEKKETPAIEEEDFFDADLISGSYTRDLLNTIKKYQEYPKKALQRNEEGDVVVKVTINAQGEVDSIDYLEKSGSRILDKAVLRMVKKAAPFQAIPSELKLEKFEFEIPFSFKL